MLKVNEIKCSLEERLSRKQIAEKLHCREEDITSYEIERESLDARHEELFYVYTVYVNIKNEEKYLRRKGVHREYPEHYRLPAVKKPPLSRPVIAGFGPAGMFAALLLAECGWKPIVIERGKCVEERTKDVGLFFKEGVLNPESNIQYGEGGAGTFSDGKLTARGRNVRVGKVLEEFVEAGADPAILYQSMPHLGTDQLRDIVRNIRKKIISLGGEVLFKTRLESILIRDHAVYGIRTNKGDILTDSLILALGHSAADTYETLLKEGIEIIPKDFAAGVRVEHPQKMINENQYGIHAASPLLSPASYRLSYTAKNKRGVYSFCMCPGGIVIPSSTEEGALSVNGMSYSARDGENANSAILVQIPKIDFYKGKPMDGFRFQKELEKNAWRSHFRAPAQNITDYLRHQKTAVWNLLSSYPRGIESADMHDLFSSEVNDAMEEALQNFDRKIPGFLQNGIMVGMESRSSSPIRIVRKEDGISTLCAGLYPCGEGAGYAGGIVSSAADGIRQAENLIQNGNK